LADKAEQLSATLGSRTEVLSAQFDTRARSLIADLDAKTETLEQRLKRFSEAIAESVAAAEARARDIARVIAEASTEGSQAISQQFEQVRLAAEQERNRTTEALHAVCEQVTEETLSLFQKAADRFSQVVRDLKSMTAEVQRQLESTRADLRRGVLELPQEMADSAAEMRRVILDQIEALGELNRIVARHGRALEAVEPVRRPEAVAVNAPASRAEVVRAPSPAPSPARAAPSPRRSESRPSREDGRAGGWLSDLLGRNSRGETLQADGEAVSGAARSSAESLESITLDIARMIDHEAASEAWERYRRGERGVFTRRLYTLQGQQTFDEIRIRYRSDRDFKQTVDRYIGEFERLLEEVERDDPASGRARSYLTSETGKVYTILAHATGRFD
jgi:uncharacterized protein YoxC